MNREISLVVVSYHFPPSAAVGGKRVARFCHYLPEFGIRPTVLTIDEGSCEALDTTFKIPEGLNIERISPNSTVLDWYNRAAANGNGNRNEEKSGTPELGERTKSRSLLKRHMLALLQFPDRNRGWRRPAINAANDVIRNSRVDAVLSSGPPWTSHAIANAISREHKLPWIADFRDAWVCDRWRKYALDSTGLPNWRDRLDTWTEDRWLRNAALVVCTTDRHRNALLPMHQRVPAERVITIPNGFDSESELTHVGVVGRNGQRTLLHAGNLYAGRRVSSFCRAMELLVQSGRLAPGGTKAIFLGDTDPDIERDALCCSPAALKTGLIEFQKRVDWKRAQQAASDADILVIFQGDHPTAVPAKFFEYLRTGKPVLAIAKDGALKDLMQGTSAGVVADPDDVTAIASAIEEVLAKPPRKPEDVERVATRFHFRNLTADLAAHIRRVVSSR